MLPGCGTPARPGPTEAPTETNAQQLGPSAVKKSGDTRPSLTSCFAAAYTDADIDGAVARCEEKQFGTQWREGVASRPDAGAGRGWLAPELIQGSVRARFGHFRVCYESGLARNANLGGKVIVKFDIDVSGHVAQAEDGGSDLPDAGVVSCIVKAFTALRFPKPERGTVNVGYPIVFNPGD
jgi:hypothetical protein